MGQVITTKGIRREVDLSDKDTQLRTLQELVDGYIEIICVGKKLMVVNEEGKLRGLPVNKRATEIALKNGIHDIIVGDVVLCNPDEID